jgi:hypothetical protein
MSPSSQDVEASNSGVARTLAASPRWLRFSLRSLLLAILGIAIVLGIWSSQVEPYRKQLVGQKTIERLGGVVTARPATGSDWQRWLVTKVLGPEAFVDVISADVSHKKLFPATIESICNLRHLESLTLDHCTVDNAALKQLAYLRELKRLSLRYTVVSDVGMPWLANLTQLNNLCLTGTDVGDEGLKALRSLKSLTELYVRWTRVTDQGAQSLQESLPACKVYYYTIPRE